jgi:hypothetical protein
LANKKVKALSLGRWSIFLGFYLPSDTEPYISQPVTGPSVRIVASLVILFAHDTISSHFSFVSDPIAAILAMFFEEKVHTTHPKFTFCEDGPAFFEPILCLQVSKPVFITPFRLLIFAHTSMSP